MMTDNTTKAATQVRDVTTTQAYKRCKETSHSWLANFGTGELWCVSCDVRGYCIECLPTPLPHAVATYCMRHRQEQEVRDAARIAQQQGGVIVTGASEETAYTDTTTMLKLDKKKSRVTSRKKG